MRDSSARRTPAARVAAMSCALMASATGLCLLVRALPGTWSGDALAFLAGVCLTPLLASPFEWLVHRYVYHRRLGIPPKKWTVV